MSNEKYTTEELLELADALAENIADHFDSIADEVGSDLLTYLLNGGNSDVSEEDAEFIINEAVQNWRDYV